MWQRQGLQPPAAVVAATDEYLSSEDTLSTWLEDRCELTAEAWTSRTDLFWSWSSWANGAGEKAGTRHDFLDALRGRFAESGNNGVRGFRGVGVKGAGLSPLPRTVGGAT